MKVGSAQRMRLDRTGQKYGMLTAVALEGSTGKTHVWRFLCDCGRTVAKVASEVAKEAKKGKTTNCGCMTGELIARGQRTHGMSRHPAYAVWRSMNDRCRLPTHQAWENYGGRGIKVCADWRKDFAAFWRDMGPTYRRGLEIDRRDNSAGYCAWNCRWVTSKTQSNNTRRNVRMPPPFEGLTVKQASELSGIGVTTLFYRLSHGWPPEKMYDPPHPANRGCMTS